jgi:hypothetical protein
MPYYPEVSFLRSKSWIFAYYDRLSALPHLALFRDTVAVLSAPSFRLILLLVQRLLLVVNGVQRAQRVTPVFINFDVLIQAGPFGY